MTRQTNGHSDLPDFKELNDRIITEPSLEPKIVVKTPLDPENVTEENPYIRDKNNVSEGFGNFFKGEGV